MGMKARKRGGGGSRGWTARRARANPSRQARLLIPEMRGRAAAIRTDGA